MSIVSPGLVIGTFSFRFELSLSWLIIPNVVFFLWLKLLFMVHWWCIYCKWYVCSILGMWQTRTGTTGFAFVLGDFYWSSASRCGLARGVSRNRHVLALILMDWPIISPKPSANWAVLTGTTNSSSCSARLPWFSCTFSPSRLLI